MPQKQFNTFILSIFIMLSVMSYFLFLNITKTNLKPKIKNQINTIKVTSKPKIHNTLTYNSKNISKPLNNKKFKSKVLQTKLIDKYSSLVSTINAYLSTKKGHYGVYFISLTSQKEFGINSTENYIAASTIKVPINSYIFKLISEGKVNPEEKLTYTENDYETGTGNLQYESFGNQYSIRTLCALSIKTSDNVATNMLLRRFGLQNTKNFEAQITKHTVDLYKNISCPKDMAIYLKYILQFQKQHPKEGNEFISNLKNTIFTDRIPKLLPSNVPVAHKIGNQIGYVHDVGIVFAKKPFIISIMSKNIENSDDSNCEAYEVIPKISKMIYDFEQNNVD